MSQWSTSELVSAYASGAFLMADEHGVLGWYSSPKHALIPLDHRFHVPTSLKKARKHFEVRINADFAGVLQGCATAHRTETWISPELAEIYHQLNRDGVAYSFETWHQGRLAGGILGLAIGGVFIGESMFYHVPEASKVAMWCLVEHLRQAGFTLFDAQIQNPHLARFGAYEMKEAAFLRQLRLAVRQSCIFKPN